MAMQVLVELTENPTFSVNEKKILTAFPVDFTNTTLYSYHVVH